MGRFPLELVFARFGGDGIGVPRLGGCGPLSSDTSPAGEDRPLLPLSEFVPECDSVLPGGLYMAFHNS